MVVLSRMLSSHRRLEHDFHFLTFLTEHELACVFRAETTFGTWFHLEWVFWSFFLYFWLDSDLASLLLCLVLECTFYLYLIDSAFYM